MPLFRRKPRFEIVREIPSEDQDRAAEFVRAIVHHGKPEQAEALSEAATRQALQLFGRAYIVDYHLGGARPVKFFEDITHPAELISRQ